MRASEFIIEYFNKEFYTGGSLGIPFPGTYEQEYAKFKDNGPRRLTAMTSEALDSSYDYRDSKKNPGRVFYFHTEDGTEYKVQFGRAGKAAEIAFYSRGQGDEHKIGVTGTGNASKIFGTVVNIVKDYLAKNNIMTLMFTANNSEPSRVKLYNTLASRVGKVLPEYSYIGSMKNRNFTQFTIKHNNAFHSPTLTKAKQVTNTALDAIFEDTTTLNSIYDGAYPDQDEHIWNYVGDNDFDMPFQIHTISPMVLQQTLEMQYGVDDIEDLFYKMQPEQEAIVRDYENDPNLSQQIIVFAGDRIIDGNHRALAAVLANKPIRYINVNEES